MKDEIIKITSTYDVILSEDENSDSLDAKFIICDFDPNGNNVSLNRETIDNWIDTLKSKPVVGKIVTRFDGKRDFSGHNVKIVTEKDEHGNEYQAVEFDTSAFGGFYDVSIEEIDGIEYITASAKIWKRFKESYEIFKKRVSSKKGLKTSWEITVSESHYEKINGKDIKVVDTGTFIGHCVLGEFVQPAYKSSGVLSVASQDDELALALSQDFLFLSNINEGGELMGKNNSPDNSLSALTDNDLYTKVRKAINSTSEDKWFYLAMLYPYEYKAVAYNWDRASEEDYVEFTYVVNSDDTISITAQQDVKLRFVPVSEIESQISELQDKLSAAEKEIAEAGKSITELSKDKEQLESQIAELNPYKEKAQELEQAEKERELSEKKEELEKIALEDDLITSEELTSDEQLVSIFAELTLENFETSQEKIEVIKGRKAIAKFKETKGTNEQTITSEQGKKTNKTETSQVKTNLNGDDNVHSAIDIIKAALKI